MSGIGCAFERGIGCCNKLIHEDAHLDPPAALLTGINVLKSWRSFFFLFCICVRFAEARSHVCALRTNSSQVLSDWKSFSTLVYPNFCLVMKSRTKTKQYYSQPPTGPTHATAQFDVCISRHNLFWSHLQMSLRGYEMKLFDFPITGKPRSVLRLWFSFEFE